MNLEREKQKVQLLEEVLKLAPGRRQAFLEEACGGDSNLRKEVESMLASAEQADDFLENPAVEAAVQLLADGDDRHTFKTILPANTVLQDRYEIIGLIGEGGYGQVYKAKDRRLRNTVAIKSCIQESYASAFEREAQLLANLRHTVLPQVKDHFAEGGKLFLVMEYISGEDLAQMLKARGKPFAIEQVLHWADRLLDALEYLHRQKQPVIHRDIKPSNLKLDEEGQIILLDFGIAKGRSWEITREATEKSLYGFTPNYAPPEQINDEGTDARSDLYALGATLYHLLTGRKPADGVARLRAVVAKKSDPLRPANEVNQEVGDKVTAVLMQALELDADKRPTSATEMREALRKAVRADLGDSRQRSLQDESIENLSPTNPAMPLIQEPAKALPQIKKVPVVPQEKSRPVSGMNGRGIVMAVTGAGVGTLVAALAMGVFVGLKLFNFSLVSFLLIEGITSGLIIGALSGVIRRTAIRMIAWAILVMIVGLIGALIVSHGHDGHYDLVALIGAITGVLVGASHRAIGQRLPQAILLAISAGGVGALVAAVGLAIFAGFGQLNSGCFLLCGGTAAGLIIGALASVIHRPTIRAMVGAVVGAVAGAGLQVYFVENFHVKDIGFPGMILGAIPGGIAGFVLRAISLRLTELRQKNQPPSGRPPDPPVKGGGEGPRIIVPLGGSVGTTTETPPERSAPGLKRFSRLSWAGGVIVLGLVAAIALVLYVRTRLVKPINQAPSPIMRTFEFEVPRVDAQGKVIEKNKKQARYFSEDLGNGMMLEMVEIPEGTFLMGSSDSEAEKIKAEIQFEYSKYKDVADIVEKYSKSAIPQHRVHVPKFYLGKYEVTLTQWRAVASLPKVKVDLPDRPKVNANADNLPVEDVPWEEAMEFCARLSKKSGRTYRLPSEAEWEYACRAGTTTPFALGETITLNLVNYYGASPDKGGWVVSVGSLKVANGFGLYDMHGNVYEWCLDPWHKDYTGAPADGSTWAGNATDDTHIVRGGSYISSKTFCRSSFRNHGLGSLAMGFRVAWAP